MPHLLVTGGAGFIGTNYVYAEAARAQLPPIVVVDALHYAAGEHNLDPLIASGRVKFIKADICDRDVMQTIITREHIDTIVNFAAHTHVDRSIADPTPFVRNNVAGTCALLQAATAVFVDGKLGGRFHQISTDEVYGSLDADALPWDEKEILAPSSPYAASKASAEHFVHAFARTYGLEVTISRCSNNYGPFQHPEKLLPKALACLLQGKRIPLYGDGLQKRDWMYLDDHVRAIDLILEHGTVGETYNLGGNCECTNREILHALYEAVAALFATRPELATRYPHSFITRHLPFAQVLQEVCDRKGHDRRYSLNCTKAQQELNFRPQVGLQQGLAQVVLWYIEHENWRQNLT